MRTEGDGEVSWRLTGSVQTDRWTYEPLAECTRVDFPVCPICRSADGLTDEHVPPEIVGGSVLTRTCGKCNNKYGTYEDALAKRTEHRYTMALRGPGLLGTRRLSDVIVRFDGTGGQLISPWNGSWPEWAEPAFAEGGWEFQLERPCSCRAYASVLKSAYLAACTLAPDVVTEPGSWPVAELVRQQLVRWRDGRSDHLTMDSRFNHLHVRYNAPRLDAPAVLLCRATDRDTGEQRQVFRLGWQLVVDWPIDATRLLLAPSTSS